MLEKIFLIVKKVVLGVLFIYAYNKLALPLNVFIPMNIFTVILVSLCGVPSILMLVLYFTIFI